MFYLIEHNRTTKETNLQEYFDYDEAQNDCFIREQSLFQAHRNEVEVVVFEADSIEDLKRTHSRYFAETSNKDNTKGTMVAAGLIGLALYLLK